MIEGSLISIVIISALLFGAVYPWSIAIVGVSASLSFIFFLWKLKGFDDLYSTAKGITLSILLLFLYPLFQLIPLPLSTVGAIHHKFKEIITISSNVIPVFHSISVYPFATEMELSRLFIYLTIFSMAAFGIQDEDRVYRVIKALIVFGFILGVFGIIQHATWNGKIYWFKKPIFGGSSPFGPFVNKNHFAGFIGMIIPFSLGIALMSRSIEKKVMYAFFGVAMAIALFFSLSRGGIISFFAGVLVFTFIIFSRGMSKRKLIPIVLFILVLAVYLLFLGISPIMERFTQGEVSIDQRFAAWQGTLSAFKDYPIFGSGFGTFQYIFTIYQPEGLYLYWKHAHNDYLELLLELGVVGTTIVAIFLFSVLKMIMKTEWKDRELYLGAAFFSSITTIAIHSIVDFNLHIPSNALLFFLILGLAVSLSREKMVNLKTRRHHHR